MIQITIYRAARKTEGAAERPPNKNSISQQEQKSQQGLSLTGVNLYFAQVHNCEFIQYCGLKCGKSCDIL